MPRLFAAENDVRRLLLDTVSLSLLQHLFRKIQGQFPLVFAPLSYVFVSTACQATEELLEARVLRELRQPAETAAENVAPLSRQSFLVF